jgi:hypothetical protein
MIINVLWHNLRASCALAAVRHGWATLNYFFWCWRANRMLPHSVLIQSRDEGSWYTQIRFHAVISACPSLLYPRGLSDLRYQRCLETEEFHCIFTISIRNSQLARLYDGRCQTISDCPLYWTHTPKHHLKHGPFSYTAHRPPRLDAGIISTPRARPCFEPGRSD